MTYSIVARDPASDEIGIIVASRFFACCAAEPYVGRCSAVATQAFVNPLWGTEGRRFCRKLYCGTKNVENNSTRVP